eukprot:GHVS01094476.1.p1 GENE.GHVS01094476.1~~GHVS01094476.1.p1  ORF type:complete len:569 (-),score=158.13 GHVS01094476.1:72-1556(-)
MAAPSSGGTDLNVTPEDLEKILSEDEQLRFVYADTVPSKMTEKAFWERFFQSRYFYEMIGKPAQAVGGPIDFEVTTEQPRYDEDGRKKEQRPPRIRGLGELLQRHFRAEQPQLLRDGRLCSTAAGARRKSYTEILPDLDLIRSEADRMGVGFGSISGANSMTGELAEEREVVMSHGNRARMSLGSLPVDRRRHFRALMDRFNVHGDRVLREEGDKRGGGRRLLHEVVGGPEKTTGGGGAQQLADSLELEDLTTPSESTKSFLKITRQDLYAQWTAAAQSSYNSKVVDGQQHATTTAPVVVAEQAQWVSDMRKRLCCSQEDEEGGAHVVAVDGTCEDGGGGGGEVMNLNRYIVARTMFVYNTKLCQGEKALQIGGGLIDYERDVIENAAVWLTRVKEVLRHYYSTNIVQIEKRAMLLKALQNLQPLVEAAMQNCRAAAARSLYTPVIDMIKQVRQHSDKVKQYVLALRQKHGNKTKTAAASKGGGKNVPPPPLPQ